MEKKKIQKCIYAKHLLPDWKTVKCFLDDKNIHAVCDNDCENCSSFKSKYIEYPITINKVENETIDTTPIFEEVGTLCSIRPCGEEYQNKTYLGILIGNLPIAITTSFNEETGVLTNRTLNNPGIYVPELKKIIYGNESFWGAIESEDDMREITDSDIENVGYIRLLKSMIGAKEEKEDEDKQ